jgi:hypothetical protein
MKTGYSKQIAVDDFEMGHGFLFAVMRRLAPSQFGLADTGAGFDFVIFVDVLGFRNH